MNYPAMKTKTITVKTRAEAMKSAFDERQNRRLRAALRKAVNRESAPESLREKISRMIRE